MKPANILVGAGGALKLIDFGSACDVRNIFWTRGINTLDPLYAAPELRLSVLGPEKFDVFSVGMVGVGVLMPGFASEGRLREFRRRLEIADYDLRRYREDFLKAKGGTADRELRALFGNGKDVETVFEVLSGMLKGSPSARKSVQNCLSDLGML